MNIYYSLRGAPRSAGDEGLRAEDIRRAPQTAKGLWAEDIRRAPQTAKGLWAEDIRRTPQTDIGRPYNASK